MERMTLRAARKAAKLSKTRLSELVGLHRLTIARIEHNEQRPLFDSVQRLQDVLSARIGRPVVLTFPRQARRAA